MIRAERQMVQQISQLNLFENSESQQPLEVIRYDSDKEEDAKKKSPNSG